MQPERISTFVCLGISIAILLTGCIAGGAGQPSPSSTSSSPFSSTSLSSSSLVSSSSSTSSALPNKAITVWLAGDSTVANGVTPCPAGWGKYLASYFNAFVTVRNSAAGGRSVRTWLYDVLSTKNSAGECNLGFDQSGNPTLQSRWQEMLKEMKVGDYLLIQFGINDGDPNCPRHVGSSAFKDTYQYLANEAQRRGVTPVFITPVSAIRCGGSTAVATRGFLPETFDIGNSLSVPVLDLHGKSVELYNSLGFCPAPNGDASAATTQPGAIGDFFCDDHTHFDNPGAKRIAKVVTDLIRAKGLPLASYLVNE